MLHEHRGSTRDFFIKKRYRRRNLNLPTVALAPQLYFSSAARMAAALVRFSVCASCAAVSSNMSICARCLSARYCGVKCQREAYAAHRKQCKASAAAGGRLQLPAAAAAACKCDECTPALESIMRGPHEHFSRLPLPPPPAPAARTPAACPPTLLALTEDLWAFVEDAFVVSVPPPVAVFRIDLVYAAIAREPGRWRRLVARVEAALLAGLDPHPYACPAACKDCSTNGLLYVALRMGSAELFSLICERSRVPLELDIEFTVAGSGRPRSALYLALDAGSAELAAALLARGARFDTPCASSCESFLNFPASQVTSSVPPLASRLLAALAGGGLDLDAPTSSAGRTLLTDLVHRIGLVGVDRRLLAGLFAQALELGADPNALEWAPCAPARAVDEIVQEYWRVTSHPSCIAALEECLGALAARGGARVLDAPGYLPLRGGGIAACATTYALEAAAYGFAAGLRAALASGHSPDSACSGLTLLAAAAASNRLPERENTVAAWNQLLASKLVCVQLLLEAGANPLLRARAPGEAGAWAAPATPLERARRLERAEGLEQCAGMARIKRALASAEAPLARE